MIWSAPLQAQTTLRPFHRQACLAPAPTLASHSGLERLFPPARLPPANAVAQSVPWGLGVLTLAPSVPPVLSILLLAHWPIWLILLLLPAPAPGAGGPEGHWVPIVEVPRHFSGHLREVLGRI